MRMNQAILRKYKQYRVWKYGDHANSKETNTWRILIQSLISPLSIVRIIYLLQVMLVYGQATTSVRMKFLTQFGLGSSKL